MSCIAPLAMDIHSASAARGNTNGALDRARRRIDGVVCERASS
ncbi:hypothetical protein ABU614_21665 [Lysobacter firmicutimachus]|uniref:Uncharacterized protein n=1 Tax=Lysobacter firmicutimachus TaxID=1792846 RepID=A0AAU8MRN7_9GAMM